MQYLEFDTTRLDHVLEAHGAYMIAKFHRLVKPTGVGRGLKKVSKRIYVINAPIDIYPILPHADVLVTDYSSVFFDFLLLDRPIVFYVPDCERYLRERGFVLNFDSYTPGPKAKSFEELLLVLDNVFLGKDEFVEQRKRVQQYAFDYVDGLSSGRVIRAVIDLLNLHATE
jgi:CDP-glycerol glycerophosphotransferase (TagB/SpsB family)